MKFEANKDNILRAIHKVEKITSKNPTLPVLSCILVQVGDQEANFNATNLDIGISVKVPIKDGEFGSIAVPSGVISSYVSGLSKSDTTLNFASKDNNLILNSKSSETSIKTQSIEDFPDIPKINTDNVFKIKSRDLINGLKSVFYSSAISSIKPELASVYIYSDGSDMVFVATDSFRLAEKKISIKNLSDFKSILIPFRNVSEIIRVFDDINEEIEIKFQEDQISFETSDIYLVSRVVDGNFPDYKQIIPKDTTTEITLLKEDLIQGLRLTNIFSGKFNQVVFSAMPKDNILEIYSNDNDRGESRNRIKSSMEGDSLKISFNNRYINDCFSSIDSDSLILKFNGLNKPMVIKGVRDDSFLYLVMPMNR